MIKTFAQCSGDHKLDVSTEFPMDQGWVVGYVESQTDDTQGSSTTEGTETPKSAGRRKRICIEAWADDAAYRPNVGHYCSVACAVADLERALVTRRYNGAESQDPDLSSATIPYRVYRAEAYSNQ
ncbi:MAG TPA: hypothetical protein VMT20_28715 [Terriglobia bacterium]|nr:hypothetical protein [Terriglobia bacterium]